MWRQRKLSQQTTTTVKLNPTLAPTTCHCYWNKKRKQRTQLRWGRVSATAECSILRGSCRHCFLKKVSQVLYGNFLTSVIQLPVFSALFCGNSRAVPYLRHVLAEVGRAGREVLWCAQLPSFIMLTFIGTGKHTGAIYRIVEFWIVLSSTE